MRTGSDFSGFLDKSKKLDADVYILDNRAIFYPYESVYMPELPNVVSFSAMTDGNGLIVRVCLNNAGQVWFQVVDVSGNGSYMLVKDWTRVFSFTSGIFEIACGDVLFLANAISVTMMFFNYATLTFGTEFTVLTDVSANYTSLAACNACFFVAQAIAISEGFQFEIKGKNTTLGISYLSKASIVSGTFSINLACTDNVLIYQLGNQAPNFSVLNWYFQSYLFQPLVTLDSLDDIQSFKVTGGSKYDYITGIVGRKNGTSMAVYMVGKDEFTSGFDYYVTEAPVDFNDSQMFVLSTGQLWYMTADKKLSANAPYMYSPANEVEQGNKVGAIQINYAPNAPDTISVQLAPERYGGIEPGMSLVAVLKCNASTYRQRFLIDSVSRSFNQNGQTLTVQGSSPRMKYLGMWESDAYYDYWSQTKTYGDTFDLSKMVRSNGIWKTYGTAPNQSLQMETLNEDGLLYMTERATPSGSIRARMIHLAGDYHAYVGLVVGYTRETLMEAKVRRTTEISGIAQDGYVLPDLVLTEDDCRKSAWLILHSDQSQQIEVYYYDSIASSVLTPMNGFAYAVAPGVWFHLMANYVNGIISIYAASDTQVFTKIGDHITYKNIGEGRAGLYLKNSTVTGQCYPFQSNSTVVPLSAGVTLVPTSEQIIVDSELINYAAKTANVTIPNLNCALGIEVASNLNLTTNVPLNQTKAIAVLRQRPNLGGTLYVKAVKIYVEKVGNPLNGLELSVSTTDQTYNIIGMKKSTASLAAKEIVNGWNTFTFFGPVQMLAADVISIMRARAFESSSTDNATNYYNIKAGAYPVRYTSFNDTNDAWTAHASQGLAFRFITYADTDPTVPTVCVNHDALLSAVDAYTNQALVVTAGSGIGSCARITKYAHGAATCVFYTDVEMATMIDETSRLSVVPALYNLTRTAPVPHLAGKIDVYRVGPMALLNKFAYFSGDVDLSLEDMVRKIARHAGVTQFAPHKLWEGEVVPLGNNVYIKQKVGVFNFSIPDPLALKTVDMHFRVAANVPDADLSGEITIRFRFDKIEYLSGTTLVSSVSPGILSYTRGVRVSAFDRYISVWLGAQLIHTFVLTDADAARTGAYFTVRGTCTEHIVMDFPDASLRVDNFVLDMGKNALSLIQQLIGNKRFFISEGESGVGLIRRRKEINAYWSPYTGAYTGSESRIEPPFTRVLVEGGEVVERRDPAEVRDHGNIFSRVSIFEINNLYEAEEYANLLIDDAKTRTNPVTFTGTIWPALEINDIVFVTFPDSIHTGSKRVIVDQISYSVNVTSAAAVMDMTVSGRAF